MLEPEQPQGQAEEPAEEVAEEVEAETAEETEGEEIQEEEVQEPQRFRVKVDNEELEVDLDELIKGYSRTSDYTKKTQTLAEQRKAVEAERTKIEEAAKLRDTYAQRLQVIEQMLTQPEEDISALKDNDPIGYAVKMAERMEREKQLAAVRAERESVEAKQVSEHQERLKGHIAQEAERLRAAIPDMADDVKGEIIRRDIRNYAKSVGWTDQELSQVYDHRAVLTLYRAMQYEKLTKGKAVAQKKVAEAPKALKPGTGNQKIDKDSEQVKKLTKQLKQSGRPRDAAALFERFL
jgi:hypothetical protein